MNLNKELTCAIEAGKLAQKAILEIYHSQNLDIEIKDDNSPVTKADKLADEIIRNHLNKEFPDYGMLTEESVDNKERLSKDFVWIIDPVDGTKDFIAKDDEFTINIALAYKQEVVLGVVFAPALDVYYYATKDNGAYVVRNDIATKINVNANVGDLLCYISVFHYNDKDREVIEKHSDKITKLERVGSSLKACYIAEGKGEISYRMSQGTKEWDTAAFQIIVEEAGGFVLTDKGEKMYYNRENVYNTEPYIIVNKKENILL